MREATLAQFAREDKEKGVAAPSGEFLDSLQVLSGETRSLSECFSLFDGIHSLVSTPERVRRVTSETLEDFAADNVTYLELRTTPRTKSGAFVSLKLPHIAQDIGYRVMMSGIAADPAWRGNIRDDGEAYLEAIIDALEAGGEAQYQRRGVTVRLLLSCNRAQGVKRAEEILELAIRYSKRKRFSRRDAPDYGQICDGWVVGFEFSGNPTLGGFGQFSSIFQRAMRSGLWWVILSKFTTRIFIGYCYSCSLHCGETKTCEFYGSLEYRENEDILAFMRQMDAEGLLVRQGKCQLRLGHALLLSRTFYILFTKYNTGF